MRQELRLGEHPPNSEFSRVSRQGTQNSRHLLSPSSGDQRSKIRVWAGLLPAGERAPSQSPLLLEFPGNPHCSQWQRLHPDHAFMIMRPAPRVSILRNRDNVFLENRCPMLPHKLFLQAQPLSCKAASCPLLGWVLCPFLRLPCSHMDQEGLHSPRDGACPGSICFLTMKQ